MPKFGSHTALKHVIREHRLMVTVFVIFGLASAIYNIAHPQKSIWGDEVDYLIASNTLPAFSGYVPSQIPGAMPYYWWPPFASAFYSLLSTDSLEDFYAKNPSSRRKTLNPPQSQFLHKVAAVNVVLLGLSGLILYTIAKLCGLGKGWSAIAVAFTLLNPRILFYERALWPEVLHLLLFSAALLFLFLFFQKRSVGLLLTSSLFFTYASFTKGVAGVFILLLSILLFLYHVKTLGFSKSLKYAALLLIPFLLLTNIQKMKNFIVHDHYAIASNTWINIEAGLIPAESIEAEGYRNVYERYQKAARIPLKKERLSKQRVMAYLASTDILSIIGHQATNFFRLIEDSFLEEGIERGRWGNAGRLKSVLLVKDLMVWLSVIAGIFGVCVFARRNIYLGTLALFLVYYLSALFVIGFNIRLLVPALPFLAIFCCFTLKTGFEFARQSSARASTE